jgi:hypothetical protein
VVFDFLQDHQYLREKTIEEYFLETGACSYRYYYSLYLSSSDHKADFLAAQKDKFRP